MGVVELEIPSKSAYVGVARLAIAAVARSAGLDEELVDDVKIAVSEACTNALLNNSDAGTDAPVSISWTEHPDRVVIEVADRGAVYDFTGLDPSDSQQMRLSMSAALLGSIVDETDFTPREGGGMCARLAIRRR